MVNHEYGGAGRFWGTTITGSYDNALSDGWTFLLADPAHDTAPPEVPVPEPLFHSPIASTPVDGSPTEDAFHCLPPEIIDRILVQLRSRDVCELRRASRVVASVSTPNDLSQGFWRSRFTPDMEMGGIYALQPRHHRGTITDWREVYTSIRRSQKDGTVEPALRNKMRIWKCLGFICDSLEHILGRDRSWQDWTPQIHSPELEERWMGPFVRSHSSHIFSNEELLLPVSTPIHSPQRISISTILLNGRRYVCGLRVSNRLGSDVGATISEVGMNLPATEGHFDVDSGEFLEGLLLYTAMDGIVGIEFHFRMTGSSTLTPRRFGLCHGPNTFAVASLEPPKASVARGIAFGFDVGRPSRVTSFTHPIPHRFASASLSNSYPHLIRHPIWVYRTPQCCGCPRVQDHTNTRSRARFTTPTTLPPRGYPRWVTTILTTVP